jgi:hypothetical protein
MLLQTGRLVKFLEHEKFAVEKRDALISGEILVMHLSQANFILEAGFRSSLSV